jgi:hypothetical protein
MGRQRDVVVAEHASELTLYVPHCRQAVDRFELEHGDSPLTVPDQDDEVEDADLAGLHQFGHRRHDGGQRVLMEDRDHRVLNEVGRDLVDAVGRLSCVSHRVATAPLLRAHSGAIMTPPRVAEDHPAAGGAVNPFRHVADFTSLL